MQEISEIAPLLDLGGYGLLAFAFIYLMKRITNSLDLLPAAIKENAINIVKMQKEFQSEIRGLNLSIVSLHQIFLSHHGFLASGEMRQDKEIKTMYKDCHTILSNLSASIRASINRSE